MRKEITMKDETIETAQAAAEALKVTDNIGQLEDQVKIDEAVGNDCPGNYVVTRELIASMGICIYSDLF
jgi:hypothetical protein